MPFKSEKQRAKFAEMVKEGKLSQATLDRWTEETGKRKLPERVDKKPSSNKIKHAKVIK